jgi:hypothetical protein
VCYRVYDNSCYGRHESLKEGEQVGIDVGKGENLTFEQGSGSWGEGEY